MMRRFMVLALLAQFIAITVSAQHKCSTDELYQKQLAENPILEAQRQEIEAFTSNFIANQSAQRAASTVYRIPVVFHVVYKYSAENVTDELIEAQLEVLNDDFRRLNEDRINTRSAFASIAADTRIEFVLATEDPTGAATTAITRKVTSRNHFEYSTDAIKSSATGGVDPWPTADYLNIWICNLSSGLLGYAQFPGMDAATDGVVIDYATLPTGRGSFGHGRTLTHEVGHYLNLYHIFSGCGAGDHVDDTPAQSSATYGCPSSRASCGGESNFENFMDYVDDQCMNMFTTGQTARMRALFEAGGARASLPIPSRPSLDVKECRTPENPMVRISSSNEATISWGEVDAAENYQILGRKDGGSWTRFKANSNELKYKKFKAGSTYEWAVRANCGHFRYSTYTTTSSFTMPTERISVPEVTFNVYPNPATDMVYVEIPALEAQIVRISVIDILGRSVISDYLSNTTQSIKHALDLTELGKGSYLIQIEADEHKFVKQLVVK